MYIIYIMYILLRARTDRGDDGGDDGLRRRRLIHPAHAALPAAERPRGLGALPRRLGGALDVVEELLQALLGVGEEVVRAAGVVSVPARCDLEDLGAVVRLVLGAQRALVPHVAEVLHELDELDICKRDVVELHLVACEREGDDVPGNNNASGLP